MIDDISNVSVVGENCQWWRRLDVFRQAVPEPWTSQWKMSGHWQWLVVKGGRREV